MLCQSLAKRAGQVDSFLVDGRAFSASRARPVQRGRQSAAAATALAAQLSLPREPRVHAPSRGAPTFLACATAPARPHLRRVLRQYELVEKVRSYDPDADEGLINRAYVFSMKAHGDQQRASGDPYFSHPIEVAGILTDLKLDDQTIATAILHDTIEDTLATPEEIEKLFGKDVARLVDGVTKLSKIEAQSENERAAENLRKFLLALSRTTSACCWSSSPTGCTTCARSTTSRSRTSAGASRARRWISTRRSPSGSACTR